MASATKTKLLLTIMALLVGIWLAWQCWRGVELAFYPALASVAAAFVWGLQYVFHAYKMFSRSARNKPQVDDREEE